MIRPATAPDLLQVYELLEALRQESIWGTIPVSPVQAYVHAKLLTILHDPMCHLSVAVGDEAVIGVCGVELCTHRFLPGLLYLAEWALYVLPRYRNYGVGKVLWHDALRWGQAQGAYGACYGRITVQTGRKCVEEIMWRVFAEAPVHG